MVVDPLTTRAPGRLTAILVIAGMTLIWGTTWAAIRIMLEGIPPLTGVALRFLVAAAVLAVVGVAVASHSGRR